MRQEILKNEILKISNRIELLASIVRLIESTIDPPLFCNLDGQGPSFRYANPKRLHIILLKSARIVSSLNACTVLLTGGYTQEIATLLRTILDFKATINFLSRTEETEKKVADYVEAYFSNFNTTKNDGKKRLPKQKQIHDSISENFLEKIGEDVFKEKFGETAKLPTDLMSNVYIIFSEYVHGTYPVLTDMFHGTPARLDMFGQSGTPKDHENLECLVTVLDSAELTFRLMLQRLNLQYLLSGNERLEKWYGSFSTNPASERKQN